MTITYFDKEATTATAEYAYPNGSDRDEGRIQVRFDSKQVMRKVLADADGVVCGDRHDSYGAPEVNHERTAQLWSVFLGVTITARQVCYCNILQKCSREVHESKPDNDLDICGYAVNAAACRAIANLE